NSHDMLGQGRLSSLSFDGGRGIANNQNIGAVYVTAPGYYGMRLLFYNGGGGDNIEFYTKATPAGVADILINDTNNVNSVKAFRISSAAPAYVSFANPPLDDDAVF